MTSAIEPTIVRDGGPEGSDRSFGIVFAVVFAVIGLWPLIYRTTPRWWALAIATAFLLAALAWPRVLRPLNKAWLAFGRLLHRIVSPLVMGMIYFLVVTPIAWIMRARGKDVLSLKFRADASSYWVKHDGNASDPQSMTRQF